MNSPVAPPPAAEHKPAGDAKSGGGSRVAREMLVFESTPQRASLPGRIIRWILLLAIVGAGWRYYPVWWPWVEARLPQRSAGAVKPPPRVIPVVAAPVTQRDLDLYLNGLGTVTALNTVTVRSRVEGELVKVAFTEGQMVQEGDLLAEIDARPFERQRDQAKGVVSRDEATLNLAKLNLARQEVLVKQNATTSALYDQQVAMVAQAQAALETNQAVLETAELQLSYCRITAPISGRVGLRLVDRGNMVRANDPSGLLVITQLEPIGVVFTIPQDEIPRVQRRIREEKELVVDAFDRDFRTKLAGGKLVAIDNQVDATTGTLRLKASFENKDRSLFPNQFVNARLAVDSLKNAFVIPSAAVQRGPEGPFVYVAKPDDTVELRMIVTGPTQGTETSIQTGLSLGEMVVTDGIDKLQPGTKISFRDKARTAEAKKGDGNPAAATAKDEAGSSSPQGSSPVADKGKA
jgi:membrane fusion protein, multidrug efflux system